MQPLQSTTSKLIREAQAVIEFEDDPHRAALEDNPEHVHVRAATWASVFFLAISFGPPVGLSFVSFASVLQSVTVELGNSAQLPWVVGAWSLASAVSFSLAGPLSDVFGRRWPLLIGEVLTIVGCIVTAAAKNVPTLIAGETIIGLATGIIFVAYAGVPEMLPNKWRSVGLGILEAGIAIPWGVVSGILANSLNEYATWRWIFYIGIIVEAVALVGTALTYWPTPRPRGDYDKSRWEEVKEIDFAGLLLFTGGLTTFLIGLTWGGSTGHPWNSASTVAPIVIGLLIVIATFTFDSKLSKNPIFPRHLFARFRQFSSLLVIVFISGMDFYPMASLLPRGSLYMFTNNGLQIGILSLPNSIMQGVAGVAGPLVAHKIGHIKWQLVFVLVLQATFVAATAAAVYPNDKMAYIFLPAFGVPMFIWVTILSYAIASLHVPHSMLGVAMGLVGTFRATGGAVGNAIFDVIFNDRFNTYAGSEIAAAAVRNGLNPRLLPKIIPETIEYNLGIPGSLVDIPGMTPAIKDALQIAVRSAYGHAFKIVFYTTIPFTVVALICSLFVEDASTYMTNHVQFAMSKDKDVFHKAVNRNEEAEAERSETSVDDEKSRTVFEHEDIQNGRQ